MHGREDIEGVWKLYLHNTFCVNPPTYGEEMKEVDYLKHVFSVLGSWVHLFHCKKEYPEGKQSTNIAG